MLPTLVFHDHVNIGEANVVVLGQLPLSDSALGIGMTNRTNIVLCDLGLTVSFSTVIYRRTIPNGIKVILTGGGPPEILWPVV